jgi:hypothetical protein
VTGDVTPHIIDLSIDRGAISFIPHELYPLGNETPNPLERMLSGPQNQTGYSGEKDAVYCQVSILVVQPIGSYYTTDVDG